MASAVTFASTNVGVAAASPPAAQPDLKTLAATADLPTLTVYARQHVADRPALERAMIAADRTGDVSRLNQALKSADYDVPIWLSSAYGSGPGYVMRKPANPDFRIGDSPAWTNLVATGQVTASEQRVISHMAANEGRLDSVQAYDSQIASLGAMQKTINPQGTGELPKQVWDFRQENPAKYQTLFADRGWTVEHTGKGTSASDYTMRLTVDGQVLTARETAAYIKDKANPEHWNVALDPLMRAGRDPDFQSLQIRDYKDRLDTALGVVPRGPAYTQPVSAYLTSEQGAALVIDQHINTPAYVARSFGRALDAFYAANPKAPADPTQWTDAQRAAYEPTILTNYQAQRVTSGMAHAADRYDRIVGQNTPLSATPGSFVAGRP